MSEIEVKIEAETKAIKEVIDCMVDVTKMQMKDVASVDTDEMYKVADIIKDLSEAKKNIVECAYKTEIAKAMEENADDYGETWDEDGKMYYRGRRRDSRGRFMYQEPMTPKMYREHDPEYYRDMDRHQGKMYYTEPTMNNSNMRDYREGRSGQSRRRYFEAKETSADKATTKRELEKWITDIEADLKEALPKMENDERTITKQRFINMANTL